MNIQAVLLVAFLQISLGMDNMPYILQRKRMLDKTKITLHSQPKNSKVDKYYYSQNLTNKHDYNITINEPDLCTTDKQVFLLVLIRSYYAHFQWREVTRELLKRKSPMPHIKKLIVKHMFIFAKSNDPHIEILVRNESKHHKDIIQEDFPETYLNLLKKVVTAWKWAVNFCPNAEYVMITNDEVVIDIEKLLTFLLQDYFTGQHDDHFALCYRVGNSRAVHLDFMQFRNMDPKYLYKGKMYPYYCHGWGYAAHIKVINKLYKASFTMPSFMPTDVWIGVLAERLGIRVTQNQDRYVLGNFERYFQDPLYPIRPGLLAVTDESGKKHHEYEVMQSIMKSMRRHWKTMDSNPIHSKSDDCGRSPSCYDFSKYYNSISIFTFVIIGVFTIIGIMKLLKRSGCRKILTRH